MIITTKLVIGDAPKKMKAFANQIGRGTMLQLGGVAQSIIVTRTQLGRDQSGAAFRGYSTRLMYAGMSRRPPGYPAPKGGTLSRTGRSMRFPGGYRQYKAGLGRGTTPQLSVSGKMLADIQVKAEDDRAILYFGTARSAAIAHGHHFGTVVPRREFFGIGKQPKELDQLERELAGLLQEYARRAGVPLQGSA